jgi:hypothetical protein
MADNRRDLLEEEALLMHANGRPGKIEIRATKPLMTQRRPACASPRIRPRPMTTPPAATWWR